MYRNVEILDNLFVIDTSSKQGRVESTTHFEKV
jgi:hypothetical protein